MTFRMMLQCVVCRFVSLCIESSNDDGAFGLQRNSVVLQ